LKAMRRSEDEKSASSATGRRFAVLATRWYDEVVDGLIAGALDAFREHGALESDVELFRVPGAFEMPLAAQKAAETGRFDGVVCLGAVVRGETPHFDYIAGEAARGLADVARKTGIPVGFGILTCDTLDQARERSGPGHGNKGAEAARAVVDMIALIEQLASPERAS